MGHVHAAIATIEPVDSPAPLRGRARVAHGTVVLTGPQTAEVDGEPVALPPGAARHRLGTVVPGMPGLAEADPLTSDTVWELDELPAACWCSAVARSAASWARPWPGSAREVTIVEAPTGCSPGRTRAPRSRSRRLRRDGVDVRRGSAVTASTGPDGIASPGRRHAASRSTRCWSRSADAPHLRPGPRGRRRRAGDARPRPGRRPAPHHEPPDLGGRRPHRPPAVHPHRRDPRQPRRQQRRARAAPHGRSPAWCRGSPTPSPRWRPSARPPTARCRPHGALDRPRRGGPGGRRGPHRRLLRAGARRRGRVVGASIVGPRAGESLAEAVLAGSQGCMAAPSPARCTPTRLVRRRLEGRARPGRADLEAAAGRTRVTAALARLRRRW